MGAYNELMKTVAADERLRVKAALINQMIVKTGINRKKCADALDLLEAVIFNPVRQSSPLPHTNVRSAYVLFISILIFFGIVGYFVFGASSKDKPEAHEKPADIQADMWYGADLSDFPPVFVKWVKSENFPKSAMEKEWALNPCFNAAWDQSGNFINFEVSCTVAPGYEDTGSVVILGSGSYGNDVGSEYGKYAKYRTLKFKWELKKESDRLYKTDPAYRAVIDAVKQMCKEIEYDWASFSAYHGAPVKKTPGMVYYLCEDYSDAAMQKLFTVNYVKKVEKWTLPGVHAWNNVIFKDGRRLYVDVTWFDNERIDPETGRIYETDDYNWENITFNRDLFEHSNIGYGTNIFLHASPQKKLERYVSK
jgi:hypothetical protein